MEYRETVLYDLEKYGLSDRNGSYLGNSGPKEGIRINGQNWIVKGTNHVVLSEYIGSRVYALLGYDTQNVILGMRNGRLVAACRDFCEDGIQLRTMCALKNRYDKKLEERINWEAHMPAVKGKTDLKETLIHLEHNPALKNVDGLEKRFWESIVVDCLLCNSSRDDSDWGLLYRDRQYFLAPVYGNSGAFCGKTSDGKVALEDAGIGAKNAVSSYCMDGKPLTLHDMLPYRGMREALLSAVPNIARSMNRIRGLLDGIPEEFGGIPVCSGVCRKFYLDSMEARLAETLLPAYRLVAKEGVHA